MIAAEGRGVLVLLGDAPDAEATLARIREQPAPPASKAGTLAQWRRTGAGSQILADPACIACACSAPRADRSGWSASGWRSSNTRALPAR